MALIACPDCAREISDAAPVCIHCGRPLATTVTAPAPPVVQRIVTPAATTRIEPSDPPRSPSTMALLSLLLVGLGQIVLGQRNKGFALMAGGVLLAIATGFLAAVIIFPAAAIDAYQVARKLQRGESVDEWEFFPG